MLSRPARDEWLVCSCSGMHRADEHDSVAGKVRQSFLGYLVVLGYNTRIVDLTQRLRIVRYNSVLMDHAIIP